MKINRKDLEWFLRTIRLSSDGNELTDSELIDQLASYMEHKPSCIDVNGKADSGRFYYSTVGYGIFSLLGERYRMGRIEIFDRQSDSGYQVDEGIYTMPFKAAAQFEDFIQSLETDLPINIEIGSYDWCVSECERDLGVEKGKLGDQEVVRAYQKKKNDEYARNEGYKDWDDLIANSKWLGNKKTEAKEQ